MRYLRKSTSLVANLATISEQGHRRLVTIAPVTLCERIYRCMQAGIPATLAHLATHVRLSESQTRTHLNRLVRLGALQREAEGWIIAAPKPCRRCGGARVQPVPVHRDPTRYFTYCPACEGPRGRGADRTVAA